MRRIAFAWIATAAMIVSPQAGLTQEGPEAAPVGQATLPKPSGPMKVYDNALGAGWANKSSAAVEFGIDIGSARKPIRIEAGPNQALVLQHDPVNAAYRKLAFLIQASPPGGGAVRVVAMTGGTPLKAEGKMVELKAGGWTKVEIPLANLGAEGAAFDSIAFQNPGDQPLGVFYVTDVVLS